MEPVEVIARWDAQGNVIPQEFAWKGSRYLVESIGRNWTDQVGFHSLVMVPGGRVFTLSLHSADLRWYLLPPRQASRPT